MGGENGVSQGTISYGASKDLILVHRVQLKPMIKAHFSGTMVSSGISDVAFASVYSEKTRLKKLMMKNSLNTFIECIGGWSCCQTYFE